MRYADRLCTSRGLGTNEVYRIQRDAAKFEQSKGKQSKPLKYDQIDVEQDKVLQGSGQNKRNACGVFQRISNPGEVSLSVRGRPKDGEDDEEVEKSEEKVLGYQRHFDLTLRDHALKRRQP